MFCAISVKLDYGRRCRNSKGRRDERRLAVDEHIALPFAGIAGRFLKEDLEPFGRNGRAVKGRMQSRNDRLLVIIMSHVKPVASRVIERLLRVAQR